MEAEVGWVFDALSAFIVDKAESLANSFKSELLFGLRT